MAWIALAALAAGTAIKAGAERKAAKKARDTQEFEYGRQKKTAEQSRASVLSNLRQYDPKRRAEAQGALEQKIAGGLESATTEAAQETEDLTPEASGKVSADYLQGRAKSVRDSANRASAMAGLLAKIRAPQDLRTKEALRTGEHGSREEILASLLQGRKATGDRLVQLAGIPDSGKMALGNLISAAGAAYGAGAGAGGAAGAAPTAGSIGPGFWDMMGKGVKMASPV